MRGGAVSEPAVDVSIVMPCLNEAQSLAHCIASARAALDMLHQRRGLRGEIVIADNGSTDGSQDIARRLGARVVPVAERGYGAALRNGFEAAGGRYLVMGDADGSYEFREAVAMVEALADGADLCMGSRFRGGIAPGAMPWKNRWIGNPVLTGVLNLLFRTGATDAHCGLRALTRGCYERLRLTGSGMEFASEMLIKASLKRERIREVPATLSPDLRGRPPHLRPWRDGWRHLRYLFMLSPSGVFAAPAAVGGAASLFILASAGWAALTRPDVPFFFGDYWTILAAAMLGVSHMAAVLALAGHLYGVREGYRRPKPWIRRLSAWVSLETMAVSGAGSAALGLAVLTGVAAAWTARDFGPADSVLAPVIGALLVTLGMQNILGGFILAMVGGNEARFLDAAPAPRSPAAQLQEVAA
jgi:glycosyltransferase involved in cell wall biosynthesis